MLSESVDLVGWPRAEMIGVPVPRLPVPERRATLIEAALRVIARDGVAAATTRAIATEAGMSLASLHYAFESRDDLIARVIDYVVAQQAEAALESLKPSADLVSTIRDAFSQYLTVVRADPVRELAMQELTLYALRNRALTGAAQRQYDSYHRAAANVLTAVAEHTGHVWRKSMPEMARIVVTFTDGITLGWLADHDTAAAEGVIDFASRALAALGRRAP